MTVTIPERKRRLYRVDEVADLFHISRKQVVWLIEAGYLQDAPSARLSHNLLPDVRITVTEVERFQMLVNIFKSK